jgi:hypothetical protein
VAETTIDFAVSPKDQQRVEQLADRYAGGDRSSWLVQAIELFEERAVFDTLTTLQARGARHTTQRGIDREVLAGLIAEAAANPDSIHAQRVSALLERVTAGDGPDGLEADHAAAEEFLAETEATSGS